MNPQELVRQYLDQVKIMQLATSSNNQPWVVTVHYYSDDACNLYWISTLARRHSEDIKQNNKVAATILVHENTPAEDYVIGITIEGTAELIDRGIPDTVVRGYDNKHGKDTDMSAIAQGQNLHKFYRLKPSQIVLFDNKNFPDNPRQEIVL
jgi:uncharacterized protein YhbP (UPF0306 family)